MADNSLNLQIETDSSKRKLEELLALLTELEAKAKSLASVLNGGSGDSSTRAALAGTLAQIGTTRSSLSAAQASAAPSPAVAATLPGSVSAALSTPPGAPPAAGAVSYPTMAALTASAYAAMGWHNVAGAIYPPLPGSISPSAAYAGQAVAFPQLQAMLTNGGASPSPLPPDPGDPFSNPALYRVNARTGRVRGSFDLTPAQAMALEAAYAGTRTLGSALSYGADMELNGVPDPMQRGQIAVSGAGALIGLGVGALSHNPIIGAAAAGIADSLLGPLAKYIEASNVNRQESQSRLFGFLANQSGRSAGKNLDYFTDPVQQVRYGWQDAGQFTPTGAYGRYTVDGPSRLQRIADIANQNLPDALHFGVNDPKIAAAYAAFGEGLYQGGQDPFGPGESYRGDRLYPYINRVGPFNAARHSGSEINQIIGNAGLSIIAGSSYNSSAGELLAETYTRRAATLFGNQAADVAKQLAPIFGSLPQTGGNVADILGRYGASDTLSYLRLQNDEGKSAVDRMLLSRVGADIAGTNRAAAFAQAQARGSAAALTSAYGSELTSIASLLGGDTSLIYAQVNQQRRNALLESYRTSDITRYEIPQTHIQGQLDRARLLPYSPSRIFALDAQSIEINRQQITRLSGRLSSLRSNGDLSEEEEFRLNSQIESLRTQNAQSLAQLSEGREDLITPLSAGRTPRFGRVDSMELAALSFARADSPIRRYGAVNGAQMRMQNEFVRQSGLAEAEILPRSRTQSMNNGMDTSRMESLIAQIVQLLGGRAGSALSRGRPNDVTRQRYGLSQSYNLDREALNDSAN